MHAPRITHLHVVKRIFRYLHDALDFGLFVYSSSSPTVAIAYSDADWLGCPNTRCFTTGYAGKILFPGTGKSNLLSLNPPLNLNTGLLPIRLHELFV